MGENGRAARAPARRVARRIQITSLARRFVMRGMQILGNRGIHALGARLPRLAAAVRAGLEQLEGRTLLSTFFVTNTGDSALLGSGTLRRAILDANLSAGPDSIHFNV